MKQKHISLDFKRVRDGNNGLVFSKNKIFLLIARKFNYHGL